MILDTRTCVGLRRQRHGPRIIRSAWRQAKVSALSLAGAVVMALGFAFVGAFFVLPAKNTWGERALNGLVFA